ncbi:hypothetical protein [Roseibacillus ishigakijimensis]|uniref:Multidrug resistance protein MdtA-like C-terminal permuted SH3 domain-containing protein n=1 Tax=Roseibacillus ishigakijimensis TaxID=454146 RepID=A0A934RUQ7_9BACT|nr:hypothetical protein [Roseibacillus ishigakijimensis]MBK1835359.1 hypothetical protein [Roseibacillus ishigakijimensis]
MKFLLPVLALCWAPAFGEHPVTETSFTVTTTIKGTLVPTKCQTLSLAPAHWKSFPVVSVPAHGSTLQAGEPLLTLDPEGIDRNLVEQEAAVKSAELKLAIANRELTELQQKNTLALEAAKLKMEHAEGDLDYHQKVGLPAKKEDLAQSLQKYKDALTYQQEELDQLQKMYEEDDLTEETEEIILVRQRARVRDAQDNLQDFERSSQRELAVGLARDLANRQAQVEQARIDYATAKLNLERTYELKKLEVAKQERELAQARVQLEETRADRALFEPVADFEGVLFYGEFKDGSWQKGKTGDFLKPGGSLPTETTVLTLMAADSLLAVQSLVDREKALEIKKGLAEAGDEAPALELSETPNLEGKFLLTLPPQEREALQFPGQEEESEVVFYQVENALTIPLKAVKKREDGTTYALVKLSEGEPEERTIELGRDNGELVEVLSGLEAGQVILP